MPNIGICTSNKISKWEKTKSRKRKERLWIPEKKILDKKNSTCFSYTSVVSKIVHEKEMWPKSKKKRMTRSNTKSKLHTGKSISTCTCGHVTYLNHSFISQDIHPTVEFLIYPWFPHLPMIHLTVDFKMNDPDRSCGHKHMWKIHVQLDTPTRKNSYNNYWITSKCWLEMCLAPK